MASALRPAPYLRHSFTLAGPVATARLRITALGLYEARLNGQRVGDGFLTPGWTDYGQRVLYQAYDVTGLLRDGENVLGAVLGDGWYSGFVGFDAKRAGAHYGQAPELLAQLEVTFTDGRTARVVTDDAWQGRLAAIRHADLLMGERHDLRLVIHPLPEQLVADRQNHRADKQADDAAGNHAAQGAEQQHSHNRRDIFQYTDLRNAQHVSLHICGRKPSRPRFQNWSSCSNNQCDEVPVS